MVHVAGLMGPACDSDAGMHGKSVHCAYNDTLGHSLNGKTSHIILQSGRWEKIVGCRIAGMLGIRLGNCAAGAPVKSQCDTILLYGFSTPKDLVVRHSLHYNDVIMSTMASQITSLMIVYSAVYSGGDQRKRQISASLTFVWGIHRSPVNSTQKASDAENTSIWWRHHVAYRQRPSASLHRTLYVFLHSAFRGSIWSPTLLVLPLFNLFCKRLWRL